MRLSISGKIILLTLFALVCSCIAVLFVTLRLLEPPLDESADITMHVLKNMAARNYEALTEKFREEIAFIANDSRLIDVTVSRDIPKAQALAAELQKSCGVEILTLTDDKGVVLARGYSSKTGDNISKHVAHGAALRGESMAGVVRGQVVPLSLRACAPIMRDGKLLGTVSIGVSLASESYVDSLKTHASVDATIFSGNKRVMTTIRDKGQRMTGTTQDSPEILDAVLKRGEDYYGDAVINGVPYKVVYWPVRDVTGQNVGMWFLGFNLTDIEDAKTSAVRVSMLTGLGIVLIFMVVAFVVGKMIAAPVREITNFASAVAGGNMNATLNIHSTDETATLASALRSMVENLKTKIAEAAQHFKNAEQETEKAKAAVRTAEEAQAKAELARREGILHAAGELSDVSAASARVARSLSEHINRGRNGASAQASRLTETANAMEKMNVAVLDVARTAESASNVSDQTRVQAENGAEVAQQAIEDIQNVRDQSLKLKDSMRELDEVSHSISQVMEVISDIADQTNLLALNAAIEAARAGEAGRGFAVVADEVRKLAEKTMTSTNDVGRAITSIQESAARSVAQVDQAVNQIEKSTERVTQSGEALAKIVSLAESTADQVRGIATASEEQSASSDEINHSITDVLGISNETLEVMKEAESAVNDLNEQIGRLTDLIATMKRN